MGIMKTATGIFTASLAVDAFIADANMTYNEPGTKLLVKAGASLAAATAIHTLKDEAVDILHSLQGNTVKKIDKW